MNVLKISIMMIIATLVETAGAGWIYLCIITIISTDWEEPKP